MALEKLFGSKALRRVILHFVVHPDPPLHFRGLARHLDLSRQSLQNSLEHLESLGLLCRRRVAQTVVYERTEHVGWQGLHHLVRTLEDPAEVLRHRLSSVPGVRAAFVFGSTAKETSRPDSDLDLFVLEDGAADSTRISEALLDVALTLGREIDAQYFTAEKLREVLARPGTSYVKRVLDGPKRWVLGSPTVLAA